MSRTIAGTLKAPDGTVLPNRTLKFIAVVSSTPSITRGVGNEFTTDVNGDYSVDTENGFYRVTINGTNNSDLPIGNISVTDGPVTDLPTLLALNDAPVNGAVEILQAIADEAQQSANDAADSAQEAADSAASIDPANFIDVTEKGAAGGVAELNVSGVVPDAQLPAYIPSSEKGVANGVATLEGDGKVPASQLPSYVDDVQEYPNFASLPAVGESGIIYIAIDDNKQWRWASTVYVEISSSMSGAEIKALYEAEPDTNAFTDAEESKLAGIQALAEVNQSDTQIKAQYEANLNTNAFTDAEQAKLAGIQELAEVNQSDTQIKAQYEANADTNAFTDAEQAKLASIDPSAAQPFQPLVAHGLMKEPLVDSDFDFPATVPNQFAINAGQYRVGGVLIELPQTNITLTAAPTTAAQFTRRDVVYLREDGSIGTFEGLDDFSDMTTAGFSLVDGEQGLWQDGTGLAVPLAYVQRDRNSGACSQYFNGNGTATFSDGNFWYNTTASHIDASDCFSGQINGSISSGISGRPDDLFYDAIYASDLLDPRVQATAPTPTQLEPNYWTNKLVANTHCNFDNEGVPVLVVKERGVVEALSDSTTAGGLVTVGDSSLYEVGDFFITINQDGAHTASGYVSEIISATAIRYRATLSAAIGITADQYGFIDRTNGDVLTVLKVEYSTSETADLTWTDIIGDPANYPRKATGVIDANTGQTVAVSTGHTVEITAAPVAGTVGNIYLRVGADLVSTDLSTIDYTTGDWADLGTKAEFLSSAQGMVGFPLIYGENGEDLIPDGTSKEFKLSRKCVEFFLETFTTDKGVTWGTATGNAGNFESPANGVTLSVTAGVVDFLAYKTPAHVLEEATNDPVLGGKLGDVWAGSRSDIGYGSSFISSLLDKVPVNGTGSFGMVGLDKYSIDHGLDSINLAPNRAPEHGQTFVEINDTDSPAAKTLSYLTAGQTPKLNLLFKEMTYDVTWGDDNRFNVVGGTSVVPDDNNVLIGTKSATIPIRSY